MTKTERRHGKTIKQLEALFMNPRHPRVPTPVPRIYRTAARYLERKGVLVAEDAVKRPGSMTVVRGYMIAEYLHKGGSGRVVPVPTT